MEERHMHVLVALGLSVVHADPLQQPVANIGGLDSTTKRLLGDRTIAQVIQMTPEQIGDLKSGTNPRVRIGPKRKETLVKVLQDNGLDDLGIKAPSSGEWYSILLLEGDEEQALHRAGWETNLYRGRDSTALVREAQIVLEDVNLPTLQDCREENLAHLVLIKAAQAAIA